jgi:NAD(P)-dependent dehydrogenase (short-subunit alcohol dehydrogenase family)
MSWVSRALADSVEWGFSMQPNMPQAKTVLVTGVLRRFGKVIVRDLAAHGWQVALHDQGDDTAMLVNDPDAPALGQVASFEADLSLKEGCEALFASVQRHFGDVDALVSGAIVPTVLANCLHTHIEARRKMLPGLSEQPTTSPLGVMVNLLDQTQPRAELDGSHRRLSDVGLQATTAMMAQSFAPFLRVCGVVTNSQSARPDHVARAVRFMLDNGSLTGSELRVDSD